MNEIFFNGVWRMDWGLGNPNKTAALIAILMVAVWSLAYVKRWGFWVALTLFAGLGVCLIHTFSRGGVIAAFCGLIPLAFAVRRPWSLPRVIGVIVSIWFIVGVSIFLQAHKRYGQGVATEDRSISNRFELWKAAPTMMVDAPSGWGIGKSGQAYMNWYQPLDQHEAYRTLVNSHLTWLVELGWLGRFVYLAGWFTVFLVCFPSRGVRWHIESFGMWIAFFVASFFSSVAESFWLWIPPLAGLSVVIYQRIKTKSWPNKPLWLLCPTLALVILLSVSIMAVHSPIKKVGETIRMGSKASIPEAWVVINRKIFGEKPGRQLRAAWAESQNESLAVVDSATLLPPEGVKWLLLAGDLSQEEKSSLSSSLQRIPVTTFVNPLFFPNEVLPPEKGGLRILIGEFSQSPAAIAWMEVSSVEVLPGVGDYVSNWTQFLEWPTP